MKKIILILLLGIMYGFSMNDTIAQTAVMDTIKNESKFNASLTLMTHNMYRGVSFGNSPSAMVTGSYAPCQYFEGGVYGFTTLNGNKEGFGNEVNIYGTFKYGKKWSLTLDDYFFMYPNDDNNNYFYYVSDNTNHFLEGRLKYDDGHFNVMASYTLYSMKADTTTAFYFEGGYNIFPDVNIFAGYVTGPSFLNFQDKDGFSNVGVTVTKPLNIKNSVSPDLKISLILSPNHKHVTEIHGVGRNPVYLVAAIVF